MSTWTLRALFVVLAIASHGTAFCADPVAPALKEASLVTEVLAWGETVTAVRLEYTDDIRSAELTSLMPSQTSDSSLVKFRLFANRSITTVYVNHSGRKGDVEAYGKYVFLDLGIENMDPTTYRSQVTFNPLTRNRPRLAGYVVRRAGFRVGAAELLEHLRGRLPEYMVPWGVGFVDQLPVTPNGKLDRESLLGVELETSGEAVGLPPSRISA